MELSGAFIHSSHGEGDRLWVLDTLIAFKLTGKDTGGALTLLESAVPPEAGPPPHLHEREDETFYVLEGEFEFLAGEEKVRASAGSVVYGPRGIAHTYRNVGDETGRFLTLITPSGLEGFFEEIGEPATDHDPAPPVTPEKIEALMATAPRYGIAFPPGV